MAATNLESWAEFKAIQLANCFHPEMLRSELRALLGQGPGVDDLITHVLEAITLRAFSRMQARLRQAPPVPLAIRPPAPPAGRAPVQAAALDIEMAALQRMVDKRSQMFDMLRSIVDQYNETSKSIIQSIGR